MVDLLAPGSSPDEDYHLASIWCPPPVSSSGCVVTTAPDGKDLIQKKLRVVATSICYAFQPNQSGACIWNIPADAIGNDGRFDRGEYPGGYYHVMHLFVGSDPYSSVFLMRAVNVMLAVLLGALLVLASARPTRRIFAYAVTSTYVPLGMFLVPSVNPSGWALIGVTTLAFAVHSYWLAETRVRLLVNGALAVVFVAIPLVILQISGFLVGEAVQPRYLLPLIPVVALVILTGARPDEAVRLRPGVAWATWAIASMANSAALVVNIRRYTTGLDGPMLPGKLVEWWMPGLPGPLATWIGGSIAFAVAAGMVVRLSYGSDVASAVAVQDPLPIAAPEGEELVDPTTPGADTPVRSPA